MPRHKTVHECLPAITWKSADWQTGPFGFATAGPGDGQITLTWEPFPVGPDVTNWNVRHRESSADNYGSPVSLDAAARSYTITGLDKTKIYDVQVYGDDSGNKAEALDVRSVRTPPVFSSAEVNEKTLIVTFSADLDFLSVHGPSAFHVTVGTSRRNVASGGVAVLGRKVTLTAGLGGDPFGCGEGALHQAYGQPAVEPDRHCRGDPPPTSR